MEAYFELEWECQEHDGRFLCGIDSRCWEEGWGKEEAMLHKDKEKPYYYALRKYVEWASDGEASYDILGYVFSYFLCIWRQIRSYVEELSKIQGTICIVFIQVVIIYFCPKSCNSISVLSIFSEKSCKSSNMSSITNVDAK